MKSLIKSQDVVKRSQTKLPVNLQFPINVRPVTPEITPYQAHCYPLKRVVRHYSSRMLRGHLSPKKDKVLQAILLAIAKTDSGYKQLSQDAIAAAAACTREYVSKTITLLIARGDLEVRIPPRRRHNRSAELIYTVPLKSPYYIDILRVKASMPNMTACSQQLFTHLMNYNYNLLRNRNFDSQSTKKIVTYQPMAEEKRERGPKKRGFPLYSVEQKMFILDMISDGENVNCFSPATEAISGLDFKAKLHLVPFPEEAIFYAYEKVKKIPQLSDPFCMLKKICIEYCRHNHIEPDWKWYFRLCEAYHLDEKAPGKWEMKSRVVRKDHSYQPIPRKQMEDPKKESPKMEGIIAETQAPLHLLQGWNEEQKPTQEQQDKIVDLLYANNDVFSPLFTVYTEKEIKEIQAELCVALLNGKCKIYFIPTPQDAKEFFAQQVKKVLPMMQCFIRNGVMSLMTGSSDFQDAHTDRGRKPYRMNPYYLPTKTYLLSEAYKPNPFALLDFETHSHIGAFHVQ